MIRAGLAAVVHKLAGEAKSPARIAQEDAARAAAADGATEVAEAVPNAPVPNAPRIDKISARDVQGGNFVQKRLERFANNFEWAKQQNGFFKANAKYLHDAPVAAKLAAVGVGGAALWGAYKGLFPAAPSEELTPEQEAAINSLPYPGTEAQSAPVGDGFGWSAGPMGGDPALAGAPQMDPALMAALGGGQGGQVDPALMAALGGGQMDPALMAALGGGQMDPALMASGGQMDPASMAAPGGEGGAPMDPALMAALGGGQVDAAAPGGVPMDPALGGAAAPERSGAPMTGGPAAAGTSIDPTQIQGMLSSGQK